MHFTALLHGAGMSLLLPGGSFLPPFSAGGMSSYGQRQGGTTHSAAAPAGHIPTRRILGGSGACPEKDNRAGEGSEGISLMRSS